MGAITQDPQTVDHTDAIGGYALPAIDLERFLADSGGQGALMVAVRRLLQDQGCGSTDQRVGRTQAVARWNSYQSCTGRAVS